MEKPEQEAESPKTIDTDSLSNEEKFALLGGTSESTDSSEPTTGEQPTVPEEEPKEEEPESTEGGESPTEEAEPKAEEEDGPKRWRAKTPQEREVFRLMQGGWEMADAVAHVYRNGEDKLDEAKKPEPDPVGEIDTQLSAAQEEIKSLEKQIEEASDEMDTAKALKLQRELLRKEREIDKLADQKEGLAQQQEQERQQGQLNAFEQKLLAYRDQALEEFPQLAEKAGADRKAFDRFIAEKESDPDYQRDFDSPRWPLVLAREFAREHKLESPERKEPEAQKKTVTTAKKPRASAAKVITASDDPSPTFQPTKEGLERDLLKMTPEQKFALL